MKILPYVVSFFIFFIPFLWFSPGEMDLGGDNSRLYFYNAAAYGANHSFYGISPSSFGYENISYFGLSFITLLVLLQKFITSPTLLISFFHGMSLALGFLGCYLSVREIVSSYKGARDEVYEIAAIAAGLFYVFSQVNIQGWDKIILTHDQFFLNPIEFYLLLRYVLTKKYAYLLSALLISFIFSHNFGFAAAPPFFAFYPLSLLFIILYARYIKKTNIPIRGLIIGGFIFFLLQSFHLVPQLYNLLSPEGSTYKALFSSEAKFDRGLGYFSGIVEGIRVSKSIFSIPQLMKTELIQLGFLLMPFVLIAGFLHNKNRLYLLTGVFFLVFLFFVSANITGFGLSFYKSLFSIPGFAMFRNFYGQWAYAFQFFYALLLGQAFVIILSAYNKHTLLFWLPVIFIMYILIAAFPLIDGSLVNKVLWQSRNVKIAMTMDPATEDALQFIKKLPEGKVLSLPISDTGYQMIAGKNGGVYQGPSMVAYLGGKKDFSGVNEFGPYAGMIHRYIADKNYSGLKNMLSILDIKYIFYNSDVRIYDEQFPDFPYTDVRKKLGFPNTQNDYSAFLSVFGAQEIFQKNTYHIYKISDADYSIYSPTVVVPTSSTIDTWDFYFNNSSVQNQKLAIVPEEVIPSTQSALFLKIDQLASQDMMYTDFPIPVLYPFVRWEPNSPIYFALAMREKRNTEKIKPDQKAYIKAQMSQGAKRISELQKWGSSMNKDTTSTSGAELLAYWVDPDPGQILAWNIYNSWEAALSRYFQSMHVASDSLITLNDNSLETEQLKRSFVYQAENNKKRLEVIISSLSVADKERKMLYSLVDDSFQMLQRKVMVENLSPGYWYFIMGDKAKNNAYNLYVHKSNTFNPDSTTITTASTTLAPVSDPAATEIQYDPEVRFSHNTLAYLQTTQTPISLPMNWQPAKDIFPVKKGKIQKGEKLSIDTKKYNAVVNKIYDLDDGKHLISFEYDTHGSPYEANIFLKARRKPTDRTEPAYLGIFRESISSRSWQTFSAVIDSSQTQTLLIGLKSLKGDGKKTIKVRNLSLLALENPPVLSAKQVDGKLPTMKAPLLHTTKINPTKYEVRIQKAPDSYMLVLSNAYSKNWKIFAYPKNTFTRDLITSITKNPIAENSHFTANGYANGWIITKGDINEADYTLVVELQSQRIFMISLLLSSITAFVVVIGLMYTLFTYVKK